MPSLRSATATAVAVTPMPSAPPEADAHAPAPERRVEQREISHMDRRARPGRAQTSVVFSINHSRWPNPYANLIDMALVLACLAIFVGVLAVGILG